MDANAWNARYREAEMVWSRSPNEVVMEELSMWPAGRALDLGCGEGRNAIWLARRGWAVVAVDYASVAVERGEQRAAQEAAEITGSLEWVCADLTAYHPEADSYDLVLVSFVHLPVAERRAMLRATVPALSAGGLLLVLGHDSSNLKHGCGGPQDPRILFTADDVVADLDDYLRDGQVRLVRADRRPRQVQTDDGAVVAWDAVVTMRRC